MCQKFRSVIMKSKLSNDYIDVETIQIFVYVWCAYIKNILYIVYIHGINIVFLGVQ